MITSVWIKDLISRLVKESPENRLDDFDGQAIFDAPLVGIADGDDPLFEAFRQVVHCQHFQPRPFLQRHAPKGTDLTHVRVIVWALPFAPEIRRSNRGRNLPSRLYSLARNNGGALIYRMSSRLSKILRTQGIAAVSPTIASEYDVFHASKFTYSSTWSERHAAYCAGLGRFGLNGALITPLGIHVRLGSIVANLPLESTARKHDEYRAPCLDDEGESCRSCQDRCPIGAISTQGLDKSKCNTKRKEIRHKYLEQYQQELHLLPTPISINGQRQNRFSLGCALCQCGVPCEDRDPFERSQRNNLNAGY
jgi:epoxyqueuosine reductase QueG